MNRKGYEKGGFAIRYLKAIIELTGLCPMFFINTLVFVHMMDRLVSYKDAAIQSKPQKF